MYFPLQCITCRCYVVLFLSLLELRMIDDHSVFHECHLGSVQTDLLTWPSHYHQSSHSQPVAVDAAVEPPLLPLVVVVLLLVALLFLPQGTCWYFFKKIIVFAIFYQLQFYGLKLYVYILANLYILLWTTSLDPALDHAIRLKQSWRYSGRGGARGGRGGRGRGGGANIVVKRPPPPVSYFRNRESFLAAVELFLRICLVDSVLAPGRGREVGSDFPQGCCEGRRWRSHSPSNGTSTNNNSNLAIVSNLSPEVHVDYYYFFLLFFLTFINDILPCNNPLFTM